ncbi:MAG: hypothetical protein INQ03_01305 [Candidatus Heimdallarchaeota archaeon]|nr:hypothetical protein [Candidatus Heimdallarchaeota archaeon]
MQVIEMGEPSGVTSPTEIKEITKGDLGSLHLYSKLEGFVINVIFEVSAFDRIVLDMMDNAYDLDYALEGNRKLTLIQNAW